MRQFCVVQTCPRIQRTLTADGVVTRTVTHTIRTIVAAMTERDAIRDVQMTTAYYWNDVRRDDTFLVVSLVSTKFPE